MDLPEVYPAGWQRSGGSSDADRRLHSRPDLYSVGQHERADGRRDELSHQGSQSVDSGRPGGGPGQKREPPEGDQGNLPGNQAGRSGYLDADSLRMDRCSKWREGVYCVKNVVAASMIFNHKCSNYHLMDVKIQINQKILEN